MTVADERLRISLVNLLAGCADTPDDREYLSGFALHCVRITFAVRALCKETGGGVPFDTAALKLLNGQAHATITCDQLNDLKRGIGLEREKNWIQDTVRGVPPAADSAVTLESLQGMLSKALEDMEKIVSTTGRIDDRIRLAGLVVAAGDDADTTDELLERLKAILTTEWVCEAPKNLPALPHWGDKGVIPEIAGQCISTRDSLQKLYQITEQKSNIRAGDKTSIYNKPCLRGYFPDIDQDSYKKIACWMLGTLEQSQFVRPIILLSR